MASNIKRKKLGQYFTGDKLANLLASLSYPYDYTNVIDPMCGRGDLLNAVIRLNRKIDAYGIDIDNDAIQEAKLVDNIKSGNLISGNAFDISTLNKLPSHKFDLVIANPPYVRYQTVSKFSSTQNIKKELLKILEIMEHLDEDDKRIFTNIIKNYSGLSDLAVPSWILCAMLTSLGGKLAIIVPEAWLSREYSLPIRWLLLNYFEIEYIVEDESRSWFEDAQIKTNLIIAKRVKKKKEPSDYVYKYVELVINGGVSTEASLVGNIFPGSKNPEELLTKCILDRKYSKLENKVGIKIIDNMHNFYTMMNEMKNSKWDESLYLGNNVQFEVPLPLEMKELIGDKIHSSYNQLTQMGILVGQGLRTGANDFFYVDLIDETDKFVIVQSKLKNLSREIIVPKEFVSIALRKQNELPKGYVLNKKELLGRVLLLSGFDNKIQHGYIENSDIDKIDLNEYISKAESTDYGKKDEPKFIPEYSSVKTNVKIREGKIVNDWYVLPDLTQRHVPEIFVPRVNGKRVKFFLNCEPAVIVDANFSSIWINNSHINKYALLAILNSSWISYNLEIISNVMGGGALKVDATHLRKIFIPTFSQSELEILSDLGAKLACNTIESSLVDQFINRKIFGDEFIAMGRLLEKKLEYKISIRSLRGK